MNCDDKQIEKEKVDNVLRHFEQSLQKPSNFQHKSTPKLQIMSCFQAKSFQEISD